MSMERIYTWQLRKHTANPKLFSSYDLCCWGVSFIMIKIKVYQVTYDLDSGQVLSQRVENWFWNPVPYSTLLEPDEDVSSFFSTILSAKQIPQDQLMIDEIISLSRTISTKSGTRKNLLFDPIPSMVVHFFFYLPSPSSTLNRALEESMEVNAFTPVPASKSSVEALEKMVIGDCSSMDGCPICLEKFNVGLDVVTCMPCFHVYHEDCILRWLQISHICPICRFEMPT